MGNFAGGSGWKKSKPSKHTTYEVKPTFKLFPFVWYDVVEVVWETDGYYVPTRTTSVLASKVPHSVAKVIVKTQES